MFAKKQLVSPAPSSAEIDHGIELAKSGDFARALEILWPEAELGIPKAQNSLGVMYGTGSGVPQDEVAAALWYRKAAEQGDSVAQFNLGWMIAQGRGVTKNEEAALAWHLKSAEQGNHMAQCMLGLAYSTGYANAAKDMVQCGILVSQGGGAGQRRCAILARSLEPTRVSVR